MIIHRIGFVSVVIEQPKRDGDSMVSAIQVELLRLQKKLIRQDVYGIICLKKCLFLVKGHKTLSDQ